MDPEEKSFLSERNQLESTYNLFSNCKIFLSREVIISKLLFKKLFQVVRQPLEFMIRSFGGKVSWENGPFPESDLDITHQIVDRGVFPKHQFLSRIYVQPQWIFGQFHFFF